MKFVSITKAIWKIISNLLYYVFGNIAVFFLYNSAVRKSKDFSGKYLGFTKRGWKWAVWDLWARLFLGANQGVKFPVSFGNTIIESQHIEFDYDDLEIFRGRGKFFQANGGRIIIGKGTWIANNTGIITANHDKTNLTNLTGGQDVIIGKNCWIGMNCVLLPGTVIGDNTIVGAGSVVNGQFPEGNCLLIGTPAYKKKDYSCGGKN